MLTEHLLTSFLITDFTDRSFKCTLCGQTEWENKDYFFGVSFQCMTATSILIGTVPFVTVQSVTVYYMIVHNMTAQRVTMQYLTLQTVI